MFTRISFSRAKAISAFMSAICSSGVFFSCSLQWRNDPLHKRLMAFPPASLIQRMEIPLSINPRISILSMKFCLLAQEHTWFTDRNSPSDTRADAISIRSTCNSVSSRRAILNFSWGANETPEVCSPSRKVVSNISIRMELFVVSFFPSLCFCFLTQ